MTDVPPTTGWGIMCCTGRKPWLLAEAYRTRREAKEAFCMWWRDDATALKVLRDRHYRIVKVRIEVCE